MKHVVFRSIVSDHLEEARLPDMQESILRRLSHCRTADAGVHATQCLACGHEAVRYNSCRNRHCPVCQGADQAAWVRAREEELLPVPYLHGVCTLPHDLLPLVHRAPTVMYGLLMRCAQQSLLDLCADPQHLGAQVGLVSVLHTWGSDLRDHPHVHMIITGGGLSPSGEWVHAKLTKKRRELFLVPVASWRARFRGLMLKALRKAYASGAFDEEDGSPHPIWPDERSFGRFLGSVGKKKWCIYLKPPFGGPRQVVRYLGRYTHRVACGLGRIAAYDGNEVTLRSIDYANGRKQATRLFTGPAFLRAFARHILPPRFRRIRMSGMWGPRFRQRNLAAARAALDRHPLRRSQRLAGNAGRDGQDLLPLAPATRPPCSACGAEGTQVVLFYERWNRSKRQWETIVPETTLRRLTDLRLRVPVPEATDTPDPENLFFLDSA